ADQCHQDTAQVVGRRGDHISLCHVFQTPQPTPPHPARVAHMSETPLDSFTSQPLITFTFRSFDPTTIIDHGPPLRLRFISPLRVMFRLPLRNVTSQLESITHL